MKFKSAKSYLATFSLVLLPGFFLSGCATQSTPSDGETKEQIQPRTVVEEDGQLILTHDWTELSEGFEIRDFTTLSAEDEEGTIQFTEVRIDPDLYSFEVEQNTAEPKDIADWREATASLLAVNGGFFDEDYETTGYLVTHGLAYGVRNRSGYDGIFFVNEEETGIRSSATEPLTATESLSAALQSYPLLVNAGQATLTRDTGKLARRSILAQDSAGRILILVSRNFCTLYEASLALGEREDIVIALNLDGGSSSGLDIEIGNLTYTRNSARIPNALVVTSR